MFFPLAPYRGGSKTHALTLHINGTPFLSHKIYRAAFPRKGRFGLPGIFSEVGASVRVKNIRQMRRRLQGIVLAFA